MSFGIFPDIIGGRSTQTIKPVTFIFGICCQSVQFFLIFRIGFIDVVSDNQKGISIIF